MNRVEGEEINYLEQEKEANPHLKELVDVFFSNDMPQQQELLDQDIKQFVDGIASDEKLLGDTVLPVDITLRDIYRHFIGNDLATIFFPGYNASLIYMNYLKFKKAFGELSLDQKILFTTRLIGIHENFTSFENYKEFIPPYEEGYDFQIMCHEIEKIKKST